MNYFLILIIIALGVGGYYEFTTIQDLDAANKQKFADLTTRLDALDASNKQLTQSVADLTKQVSGNTPQASANSATPAQAAQAQSPAPTTSKGPPPPSNLLGQIITTNGKSYDQCRLLKVEADGIVINHAAGIIKISYDVLPPKLQKRFGFDPQWGPRLTGDKVDFDEQQRQAAGD